MRAAAVLDLMTSWATSLDFFFVLDFLVFFRRALVSLVSALAWAIDFLVRGGALKLNALRTASWLASGGGARPNRAEALGDAVCVNCDQFESGPWRSGSAVLEGVLFCKHLVDYFCIGRVANVASR